MSVRTTADEALDIARANIKTAIQQLSKIVVEQCWGHDEFGPYMQGTIPAVFHELINIRKRLSDG